LKNRRITIRRSLGLICVVALILAAIFHAQLLTRLAGLLIHDQTVPASGFVVILDGDRRFDIAAELVSRSGFEGVLVFRERLRPLARCGIVPPGHEVAERELRSRGLAPGQISVIKSEGRFLWDAADRLGTWLDQRDDDLVVLTDQFGSHRVRYVVDQTLPAELAARVHVSAMVDRRFNKHDWWKHRIGCRAFFSSCVRMAYARIIGRPHPDDIVDWDPDAFERELRKAVADR
jgi:hypothetical protein